MRKPVDLLRVWRAPAHVSTPLWSRTRLIYRDYPKTKTDPIPGAALPTLRAPKSRPVPVYSISQPPQQLTVKNRGDTSSLVSPPGHVAMKFHHFQGPGVPPLNPPSARRPSSACVPLPGVGSQVRWACGRCPHVEERVPLFWGKFILPSLESPVEAGKPTLDQRRELQMRMRRGGQAPRVRSDRDGGKRTNGLRGPGQAGGAGGTGSGVGGVGRAPPGVAQGTEQNEMQMQNVLVRVSSLSPSAKAEILIFNP